MSLDLSVDSRYDDWKTKLPQSADPRLSVVSKETERRDLFNQVVLDLGQAVKRIRALSRGTATVKGIDAADAPNDNLVAVDRLYQYMLDKVKSMRQAEAGFDAFSEALAAEGAASAGISGKAATAASAPLYIRRAAFAEFVTGIWERLSRACQEFLLDRVGKCDCLSISWYTRICLPLTCRHDARAKLLDCASFNDMDPIANEEKVSLILFSLTVALTRSTLGFQSGSLCFSKRARLIFHGCLHRLLTSRKML